MALPRRPMSGSAMMFHMEPTTFHGTSSGSAMSTRHTETHGPLRGMQSAMARPSGIWIASTSAVKMICRRRESWNWSSCRICSNQMAPDQKNSLLPKVSCTE